MKVAITRVGAEESIHNMEPRPAGYFVYRDPHGAQGDRYWFILPDGCRRPDPASRFQPEGVHAASECVDPGRYSWQAVSWRRPGWRGQSIYEIHIGTFTTEGTFRAAIGKLDYLVALGVEAIEIMPIADFPGQRNWGYDGVALFAPARCYGRPDDFRALVDAAHTRGLVVILDVVYNHLGPDGNYLATFSAAYFDPERHTAWGQAFHLSAPASRPVRDFFLSNACAWFDEYRIDGMRLDATHAIEDESPEHLLAELAKIAHERGAFMIAEDERNAAEILQKVDGTGVGLDAAWSDDFHHQVRVALTGVTESYFQSYRGTVEEIVRTLENGWFYTGQAFSFWEGRPRGHASRHLPASAFIYCIENHDQVGNRAQGERLENLISREAFRAASAFLCLSPYPPLLFMGQEWGASSPFLYFTDHGGELGEMVSAGRQKEFWNAGLNQTVAPETVPDPQAEGTYLRSKLRWEEIAQSPHAETLEFYRHWLYQRRAWLHGDATQRSNWKVKAFKNTVVVRYEIPGGPVRLLIGALVAGPRFSLQGEAWLTPSSGTGWRLVTESAPTCLDASGQGMMSPATHAAGGTSAVRSLHFVTPATVLLQGATLSDEGTLG
jgi:maltooligosyltrehalose trehalohydrolase